MQLNCKSNEIKTKGNVATTSGCKRYDTLSAMQESGRECTEKMMRKFTLSEQQPIIVLRRP